MWALVIVGIEVAIDASSGPCHCLVCFQIDLLVFQAAPQSLDKDIVDPSPLPSILIRTPASFKTLVNGSLVN
jgi:hypothetical protein